VKKTKDVSEKVVFKRTTELICNQCGFTVKAGDWEGMQKLHYFEVEYGYSSGRDGEILEFDICDKCLDKIYKSFKHKPDKKRSSLHGNNG